MVLAIGAMTLSGVLTGLILGFIIGMWWERQGV